MRDRIERIVVDEHLGPQSPLVETLLHRLGVQFADCLFLGAEHPGISYAEIFARLGDRRSALLTRDRVLHNLAVDRGLWSFVCTEWTGLTDCRLAEEYDEEGNLPGLTDEEYKDYRRGPDDGIKDIIHCFSRYFSPRENKQRRVRRNRILSSFGGPKKIGEVRLIICQKKFRRGVVGGYNLSVQSLAKSKKKISDAAENWFFDEGAVAEPLMAVCWALLDAFMFELRRCPTTLYIVGDEARDRCAELLVHQSAARGPVEELTARLLAAVWLPKVAPCETELIAENAVRKLDQIASRKFKWVSCVDIRCMARNLLSPACDDEFLWQDDEWDLIPF